MQRLIFFGFLIQGLLAKFDSEWKFTCLGDFTWRIKQEMPIPSRGYDSIEVVEIILVPLSFPLVRFVRTLKLLDILGKAFEHTTLDFILCNANKVLGFLKMST